MLLGRCSRATQGSVTVIAAAIVPVLLFWSACSLGIRVNASPSLPVGFYRVVSDPRADLVEFCPGEPYAALASARGYRQAGRCPDGRTPLLKPIVARSGDEVVVAATGLAVNGVPLANSAARSRDTAARTLEPWPIGRYKVQPGTLWVVSTYESRSFDSRYFGPISESRVLNRLRPLFVW
jgi:conjugative transfer signal peptidase TraF